MDLPETLNLSSDWELGLSQIIYRNDWLNYCKEDLWVRVDKEKYTGQELTTTMRWDYMRYYWKKVVGECKGRHIIRIGLYEDCEKYTENITLDWLDEENPPTYPEFIRKFTTSLVLGCNKAGWPSSMHRTLPVLETPPAGKYPNLPSQDPHVEVWSRFTVPNTPKGMTVEEHRIERLLSPKARKKSKVRVFADTDLWVSRPLYGILSSLGASNPKHETFDNAEAAKASERYTKYGHRFLPVTEAPHKHCKENFVHGFLRYWPLYITTFGNTTKREVVIGKQHFPEKSLYISDRKKMMDTIAELIKGAIKASGGIPKAVSVKEKADENAPDIRKTEINISASNIFNWRIRMSPAICSLLGMAASQLEETEFITPNKYNYLGKECTSLSDKLIVKNQLKDVVSKATLVSEREFDSKRLIDSLWIYCNLITPSIVGDTSTQLLRVIPTSQTKRGETKVEYFSKPHYYPLAIHTINDLEIKIYNTYGKAPVQFGSDVTCMLHLRKRQPTIKEDGPTPAKQIRIAPQ